MEKEIKLFAPRQDLGVALTQVKTVYLKEHNTNGKGDWRLWHKAVVLFPVFCLLYYFLLFVDASLPLKIVGCVLLAVDIAAIGFCVMHDANHGVFSDKKWVTIAMELSLNFLGATSFFWRKKHNIEHHGYTNIQSLDHDVDAPFLRMHHEQPWHRYHKLQFIYCWLMYGTLYFAWVIINDFQKYISFTIQDIRSIKKQKKEEKSKKQEARNKKQDIKLLMPLQEHVIFWLTKAWFGVVFVYIPVTVLGWSLFLRGAGIVFFVTGLFISIVFQIAHVTQKTAQYSVDQAKDSQNEWLRHQLNTTADFATKNKILNWLLGGLGFQVEHHLYPNISHVHYPELHDEVKKVCDSFEKGLHKEYKTFFAGFWNHAVYMYRLGWDKSLRKTS